MVNLTGLVKYPSCGSVALKRLPSAAVDRFVSKTALNHVDVNLCLPFIGNDIKPNFFPISYMEKYIRPEVVENAVEKNPNIAYILNQYGLKPVISKVNIDNKLKNHLLTTYLYSKDIALFSNLSRESKGTLYKSALLHDIGKALIPEEIVQKPGKLTELERNIIDLHSSLGSEILKTTDLGPDVSEAVRLHHTPIHKKVGNEISNMLAVSDVFSALKEERAYKVPMSNKEALNIMSESENLSQKYVDILKQIYNKE